MYDMSTVVARTAFVIRYINKQSSSSIKVKKLLTSAVVIDAMLKELNMNSSVADEGVLLVAATGAVVVVVVVVVTGLQHFSPSLLLVQTAPPHVTDAALLTSSPLAQIMVTLLRTLLHFAFETQQSVLKQVSVAQTTSFKTSLIV